MGDIADLELIDSNPTKILIQLRRATRARYRYIFTCLDQGRSVDVPVEHQLTNHVMLLETLAGVAGVSADDVAEAIRAGVAQAQDER